MFRLLVLQQRDHAAVVVVVVPPSPQPAVQLARLLVHLERPGPAAPDGAVVPVDDGDGGLARVGVRLRRVGGRRKRAAVGAGAELERRGGRGRGAGAALGLLPLGVQQGGLLIGGQRGGEGD